MSNTSTSIPAQGYSGGVQHTSAPVGGTASSSPPLSNSGGSSSGAGSTAPNIEFVAKTADYVNGRLNEGWDIFQFHNTANDILANGQLQNMMSQNVKDLLSTLPSDWAAKYATDEQGIQNLMNGAQELASLAKTVWNQGNQSAGGATDWLHYQNFDDQRNSSSRQGNQGTYKDGYADHPDYTGPVGQSTADKVMDKAEGLVTDAVMGAVWKDPMLALPIAGLAVGTHFLANAGSLIDHTWNSTAGTAWDKLKAVAGTPTTWSDISSVFHW